MGNQGHENRQNQEVTVEVGNTSVTFKITVFFTFVVVSILVVVLVFVLKLIPTLGSLFGQT